MNTVKALEHFEAWLTAETDEQCEAEAAALLTLGFYVRNVGAEHIQCICGAVHPAPEGGAE